MITFYTDKEGIDFTIDIGGTYEHTLVHEVMMTDPDGDVWCFDGDDKILEGIITDDVIEFVAYENSYELETEWMIDQADSMMDWIKEGN